MALTGPGVKQALPRDKDYKLSDERGLYLLVKTSGAKYWRLKYRYGGKEKVLALGVYPDVSLAQARDMRREAKTQLRNGIDPGELKKQQKRAQKVNAENAFELVAQDWWEHQKGRWSDTHADRVWQSLKSDVMPYLGSRPIAEITPPEVLDVVRRVERRGALDVAGRVLQRVSAVFRFAVQTGRTMVNPAAELKGVLKTRKVEHRASLNRTELPELLTALSNYNGHPLTRYALKLLLLTFVRPGELRGAKWEEFDLETEVWRIPGERMKMNSDHLVPLSRQALILLDEIEVISGNYELLFPGERNRNKPISENTMTYALYRMGFKSRATSHGIRATASSILNEEEFNRDAIERQLAHMERNKVRGAYTHHAEYLADRTRMMQWWADYLDSVESGSNVIPANFRKSR